MTNPTTPGQRIKALRAQVPKLSAAVVAESVGISRTHLSMIENDGDLPGRETLKAIADYFKVSVNYLLDGGDATPEPPNTREVVEDPDELALLSFWRTLDPDDRRAVSKMLGFPPPR